MTLYEVLNVEKTASNEEIKKNFYKLSKIHHPDKGGDPEKFKEINHAYEILSDSERRQRYDMTGSEDEHNPGMSASDLFGGGNPFGGLGGLFGGMFGGFGGMGGPQQKRRMPRGPDKAHEIPLTLGDFYKGRDIQMKFHQQRGCASCRATGALKTESCNGCNGQGMRVQLRQIGPGMIQQSVSPCNDCGGEGKKIVQKCSDCSGKKYKVHEKVLNARIEPGVSEGEKMVYKGECSDSPEYLEPGDVILILIRTNETGKTEFEWNGNDLHMSIMVTLAEALLGFSTVVIGHPSGSDITVTWKGGKLLNDMQLVSKGHGMPIKGKKGEFGDLVVHIEIASSDSDKKHVWSDDERAALKIIFPEWIGSADKGVSLEILP